MRLGAGDLMNEADRPRNVLRGVAEGSNMEPDRTLALACIGCLLLVSATMVSFDQGAALLASTTLAPCPDGDGDGYADCSVPACDAQGQTCGDCDDDDSAVHP